MRITLTLVALCYTLSLLAQTPAPATPAVPEKPIQAAPTGLAKLPTQKPVLHGRHWMAITGKPLAATAGAMTFHKGGNAIDAACAMLAATCTMWDVLSWGWGNSSLNLSPQNAKSHRH